jgi:hypothetical protein
MNFIWALLKDAFHSVEDIIPEILSKANESPEPIVSKGWYDRSLLRPDDPFNKDEQPMIKRLEMCQNILNHITTDLKTMQRMNEDLEFLQLHVAYPIYLRHFYAIKRDFLYKTLDKYPQLHKLLENYFYTIPSVIPSYELIMPPMFEKLEREYGHRIKI